MFITFLFCSIINWSLSLLFFRVWLPFANWSLTLFHWPSETIYYHKRKINKITIFFFSHLFCIPNRSVCVSSLLHILCDMFRLTLAFDECSTTRSFPRTILHRLLFRLVFFFCLSFKFLCVALTRLSHQSHSRRFECNLIFSV